MGLDTGIRCNSGVDSYWRSGEANIIPQAYRENNEYHGWMESKRSKS